MTELEQATIRCFRESCRAAQDSRDSGRVTPQVRVVSHWSFPEYKYGPNGPELGPGSVVAEEQPDWTKAAEDVLTSIKGRTEYSQLVSAIKGAKKDISQPEAIADSTLRQSIVSFLESAEVSEETLRESAVSFERGFQGLSIRHRVNFRLAGLLVKDDGLSIESKGTSIRFRSTTRRDVEREFGGPFVSNPFLGLPDCVAEVELIGRPFTDAQSQQGRLISILRLYTDSPVSVNAMEMFLDVRAESLGMSWGPAQTFPWRKARLGEDDRAHLGSFWEQVVDRLPPTFGRPTELAGDAVSVAYGRFSEALDGGGSFEKLVTNAVMGLEALYFKPSGEQAELTYRLSLRVANLVSKIGREPGRTREIVDLAYDVRSDYVHGGKASIKDKKRIERLYGSLGDFQLALLDLLRVSIITHLFIETEKEALIDLLDDSLIVPDKAMELQKLVSGVKALLSPLRISQ